MFVVYAVTLNGKGCYMHFENANDIVEFCKTCPIDFRSIDVYSKSYIEISTKEMSLLKAA
jgi:uncharacterized pyridoxamine 5'-phosphate oxidase family protein